MATNAKPYGIVLPIARGNQGYFAQSFSISEQIKSNLNLLLRTKKGERRMNPEFGSGLWNVLFEQNTENLVTIVEDTIRKDITNWMRFVNVESVDVDNTSDSSKHLIHVTVRYTVPSVGITNEQVLQVDMNTTNV
jgi:phage baseplate assembly protein W